LVFRERDRLAAELKDYQKRLQTNRLYSESLEGMIDASREMISKLSSRVKHFESENFRLEHKLNVEQDKYEDRLLHLNKARGGANSAREGAEPGQRQHQCRLLAVRRCVAGHAQYHGTPQVQVSRGGRNKFLEYWFITK